MRKNSIKSTRLNSEVQRELSEIIRKELKDPRIGAMTTVTRCEVAADLKTCKVYISTLGSDEEMTEAMTALKRAGGFIRHQLAHGLNLRNTPELTFIEDHSIEYGIRMSERIDHLVQEEQKDGEEDGQNQ